MQSPDVLTQVRADTLKVGARALKAQDWSQWRNPLPDRSQASLHPMVSFVNEEYKTAAEAVQTQREHIQRDGIAATRYPER